MHLVEDAEAALVIDVVGARLGAVELGARLAPHLRQEQLAVQAQGASPISGGRYEVCNDRASSRLGTAPLQFTAAHVGNNPLTTHMNLTTLERLSEILLTAPFEERACEIVSPAVPAIPMRERVLVPQGFACKPFLKLSRELVLNTVMALPKMNTHVSMQSPYSDQARLPRH